MINHIMSEAMKHPLKTSGVFSFYQCCIVCMWSVNLVCIYIIVIRGLVNMTKWFNMCMDYVTKHPHVPPISLWETHYDHIVDGSQLSFKAPFHRLADLQLWKVHLLCISITIPKLKVHLGLGIQGCKFE